MSSSSCRNCCQRYIGCHSACDSYKEYKDIKEEIRQKKIAENDYLTYLQDAIERMGR